MLKKFNTALLIALVVYLAYAAWTVVSLRFTDTGIIIFMAFLVFVIVMLFIQKKYKEW